MMHLTPDERVHYAWLAGDYAPEALVDSLDLADPEVSDWMAEHGIYSADDLQKLIDDKDGAEEETREANERADKLGAQLDDARDRIKELKGALRDALDFMNLTSPDECDIANFQAEVMEFLK